MNDLGFNNPLCDLFQNLHEVDMNSANFGALDLDDIFRHDLAESFNLPFTKEESLQFYSDLSESLLPEIPLAVPSSIAYPLEFPIPSQSSIIPANPVNEEIFRPSVVRPSLSSGFSETNYIGQPSAEQLSRVIPGNYVLRWYNSPPERVHATSPSKLVGSSRPGTPFSFAAQLVARCSDGKFVPTSASNDIVLIASVYGRRKPKTGASKNSDKNVTLENLVKLELNPIGKPLMVSESSENGLSARAVLKQGESWVTFEGVSLTCGSNAARSQNAPAAARVWDWDYHIVVEPLDSATMIVPVISKHITTDSNRSQTREKRKRDSDSSPTFAPFPVPKKRVVAQSTTTVPLNFPPLQRMDSYTKVFSSFKSDVYDFTSSPVLRSNTLVNP